jgi:hypothetical protein
METALTPSSDIAAADAKLNSTVRKAGLRSFYRFELAHAPWCAALCLDRQNRPVGALPGGIEILSLADSIAWQDRFDGLCENHSTENCAALGKWRRMIEAALRKCQPARC